MRMLLYISLAAGFCICGFAAETADTSAPTPAPIPTSAPPDPAKTIPRALTYLVDNGNEWIADRNCATCHHMPMMIWALREAKKAGFPVDDKSLAKALEWTLSPKVEATTFPASKTPERDIVSLAGAYIAFALEGSDSTPPASWKKMVDNILKYQEADGSWPPNSGGRPPILSAAPTHVPLLMANALVVHTTRQSDPAASAAQEKAVAWISAQPAEDSTQYHSLRLILNARLIRAPDEVKQSIEWLRSKQKADGGWAQTPEATSDAYATGQAVCSLTAAGVAADDPAIQRAREFLTKTQIPDGSWPMKSNPTPTSKKGADNLEPIIYSATGWATVALSRTQPRK